MKAEINTAAPSILMGARMLKPIPIVSKPDNFCAFNGHPSIPIPITRKEAAKALLSMRPGGKTSLRRVGLGKYVMTGLNTLVLTTRP